MSSKPKVLLIGWDGADWEHINPLMDQGLLPTLNRLVNQGTIGNLATLQPVLSPMLWNSVATCKFADKHGILGFTEKDPHTGGARPYSSVSRKTKALWNIFSQNGIRSNVINWWASHPAEKINGSIVSNLFNGIKFDPDKGWAITPGTIHPAEKQAALAQFKMFPGELTEEHILPFIPKAAEIDQQKDRRLSEFAKTFAEMMSTHAIATTVMETEPWDFMAIYYTGIDHFSHGFMQYHPPRMPNVPEKDFAIYKDVVTGAYRFHDMMLERLLQLAGDDTTVILCSDHGFQSGEFRPQGTPREPAGPAVWHRQYGIMVMKGPGIKQDERVYGASLIDIGPTILGLYGLPIGDDMDGRPLLEVFETPPEISTIPSWDEVDGDHGMHDGEQAMSGVDSEELMKQFVALGYIDDQGTDKEKQANAAEIESQYNLARCLMWQQRHEEARPLLESILNCSPWESRFIVHLAECYLKAGYLSQAEQLILKAFDLQRTTMTQILVIYAQVKLAQDAPQAEIQLLRMADKRMPRFPAVHVQIGDLFCKQRKWADAEQAYVRAIEQHPEMARAYEGLSTVYLRQKRNQQAVDAALQAVGLLHRLPKAHMNLGIALARSNDMERARLAFQTAARFAPKQAHPQRWLRQVNLALGDTEQAEYHRRQSILHSELLEAERKTNFGRREMRFDLPEIPPEIERNKRIVEERPAPGDPTKKSGKTFVLVSGLPRSGTSLMMQMLAAGGMEIISDGQRIADEDNPRGYYEWEEIKRIGESPELLDDSKYNGQAIKVVSPLLNKMPRQHDYRVIFMVRPVNEVAASQQKMIDRLGTDGATFDREQLERSLAQHRNSTLEWLSSATHMESIQVNYADLLNNPESTCVGIQQFLGDRLPKPENLTSAVDRTLYRNRQSSESN